MDVTIFYARMRATHSHFVFTLITNIYRIVMAHRVYRDTVKCIHSGSIAPTASPTLANFCSFINQFLLRNVRKDRKREID